MTRFCRSAYAWLGSACLSLPLPADSPSPWLVDCCQCWKESESSLTTHCIYRKTEVQSSRSSHSLPEGGWDGHPQRPAPSWTSPLPLLVDSLKPKLFKRYDCRASFPCSHLSTSVRRECSCSGEIGKSRQVGRLYPQIPLFFFRQQGWLANSLIKGRSSRNLLSQPHLGCLHI